MIHIDPASAEFERIPRYQQARIYLAWGWSLDAIADEMDIKRDTVRIYVNPAVFEKKREARKLRKREVRRARRAAE